MRSPRSVRYRSPALSTTARSAHRVGRVLLGGWLLLASAARADGTALSETPETGLSIEARDGRILTARSYRAEDGEAPWVVAFVDRGESPAGVAPVADALVRVGIHALIVEVPPTAAPVSDAASRTEPVDRQPDDPPEPSWPAASADTRPLSDAGASASPEPAPLPTPRVPEALETLHRDFEDVMRWLERERNADATRMGLVGSGAAVGAVLDTAVRARGQVRALVLLGPTRGPVVPDPFDVLDAWDDLPTLVVAAREDASDPLPLVDALASRPTTEVIPRAAPAGAGARVLTGPEGRSLADRIAEFFHGRLVDTIDLRIPCFAADHPAVDTPGFVRRALRARRTNGQEVFELLAFGIGDRLTLGAMVEQPFDGEVLFHLGTAEPMKDVVIRFEHPRGAADREPPIARWRDRAGERRSEASQASAGPWGWVTIELSIDELGEAAEVGGAGFELSLELRPTGGAPITLPASPPIVPETVDDSRAPRYRAHLVRHESPPRPPEATEGADASTSAGRGADADRTP